MEQDLSLQEDPLWIVPYSTVALDYQGLMVDFKGYAQVGLHWVHAAMLHPAAPAVSFVPSLCARLVVLLLISWLPIGCFAPLPCEPRSLMYTDSNSLIYM